MLFGVGIFAYIENNAYLCYVIKKHKTWGQHGKFCNEDMITFGKEFKREYGVSAKLFDILNKLHIISATEWHHTSMYGNQTDFYEWRSEDDIDTFEAHKKELNALVRRIKSEPKMKDYAATREGMDRWEEDLELYYDESIFNGN